MSAKRVPAPRKVGRPASGITRQKITVSVLIPVAKEAATRAWQAENGVQMGHVLYKDRNGTRERITLKDFREELESHGDEFDGANEWGGCGCALPL